jgi:hypothetical protein
MSYSFDPSLGDDVSWVRFVIGDTDSNGYYLQDETIQYLIDAETKEQAVIDCIEHIITQLSAPTTKLDWLTVDYSTARAGYEKRLEDAKQKYGITNGVSFAQVTYTPWRADSKQEDGVYTLNTDETID